MILKITLLSTLALCALAQDTPPVLANFGWANAGTCVANQTASGKITMFHPGAASLGFNWCVIAAPLPTAPPYTVITGLTGHILGKAASLGFVLFDASTGKFIVYSLGVSDSGSASIAAWKMTNYTTYAGAYYTYNTPFATGGTLPKYLRIKDNGTYRTFAISHDKETWLTIHITNSGDFLTPNYYGYALRGAGDSLASIMTVFHEAVTAP